MIFCGSDLNESVVLWCFPRRRAHHPAFIPARALASILEKFDYSSCSSCKPEENVTNGFMSSTHSQQNTFYSTISLMFLSAIGSFACEKPLARLCLPNKWQHQSPLGRVSECLSGAADDAASFIAAVAKPQTAWQDQIMLLTAWDERVLNNKCTITEVLSFKLSRWSHCCFNCCSEGHVWIEKLRKDARKITTTMQGMSKTLLNVVSHV